MYSRILVPFDGSPASESALQFADRLAASHLRVLRVETPNRFAMPPVVAPQMVETSIQDSRAELEAIAARHRRDGRTVEAEVRLGDPSREILDAAGDCDLIVMGTQGRGAAGRAIFGSTADRVARQGETPTLLLRGGEQGVGTVEPARVVLTLDGSELAETAVNDAQRLAEALAVPVHLVRAVGMDEVREHLRRHRESTPAPPGDDDAYDRGRQGAVREAQAYLDDIAARLQGMKVSTQVVEGTPAFELVGLVRPEDVVVLTSQGRGGFERWRTGSVAEKLVREAPAPVLLAHPTPAESARLRP